MDNDHLTATYMIDLGDRIAFLAMEDVMALGKDKNAWPSVMKPTNQKEVGLLCSGRSGVPDRYSAARAYAAMSRVGETKAAVCAGRWLARDVQSSSAEFEREIRRLLRRVSDREEIKEEVAERPSFCSPEDAVSSEREIQSWSFGSRPGTNSVLKVAAVVCKAGGEGWVPVCTGGRALGFYEGDFDLLLYSTNPSMKNEKTMRLALEESVEDVGRMHTIQAGDLVTVPDMQVGQGRCKVDFLFSKEGMKGYYKAIRQGLFFEYVLGDSDMHQMFTGVRRRARACGVVNGAGGMLNMWSVMVTCLEWLSLNDYVGVNTSLPVAVQRPVLTGLSGRSLDEAVRDYFLWMRAQMISPDKVFGSFIETGRWANRSTSEFATCNNARVCRDPFSHRVDNCMRTVSALSLKTLTDRLAHAAYCSSRTEHKWTDAGLLARSNVGSTEILNALFTEEKGGNQAVELIKRKDLFIAIGMPAGGIGISDNESDARIRCVLNSGRVLSDRVSVVVGPALQGRMDGGVTMRKVLDIAETLYGGEVTEEGIWLVGLCSCEDVRDESVMTALGRNLAEGFIQAIYQMADRANKSAEI